MAFADLESQQLSPEEIDHLAAAQDWALDELQRALRDDREVVRVNAARLLGALALSVDGEDRARRLALLSDALQDEASVVRKAVVQAIARAMGPDDEEAPGEDPIAAVKGFEDKRLSMKALKPLAAEAGLARLIEAAQRPSPAARANAALTIACVDPPTSDVARQLGVMLFDRDAMVREAALEGLEKLEEDAAPAAPWLLGSLSDEGHAAHVERIVTLVASFFEHIGSVFIDLLRGDPTRVRAELGLLLARLGADAVPTLARALEHESPMIRGNAVQLLADLREHLTDEARAALEALLSRETQPEIQRNLRQLLRDLSAQPGEAPSESQALDALQSVADDPDPEVRDLARAVLERLARRDDEGLSGPPFPEFETTLCELSTLQDHADALDLASLQRMARDGRAVVRVNTARAFAVLNQGLPDDALLLLKDSEPRVRLAMAQSIAALAAQPGAASAAPILIAALADRDEATRAAAANALVALEVAASDAILSAFKAEGGRELDALRALVGRMGAPGLHIVNAALDSPIEVVRVNGVLALRDAPAEAQEGVRARLDRASQDASVLVRRAVVGVEKARAELARLDRKGEQGAEGLPVEGFDERPLSEEELAPHRASLSAEALARALRDGRHVVRANAARALGLLGDGLSGQALSLLALTLKDSVGEVRVAAARALASATHACELVVPALVSALEGADPALRDQITQTLEALGDRAVAPSLTMLRDVRWPAFAPALHALFARHPERYTGPLIGVLEDASIPDHFKAHAERALGAMDVEDDPEVSAALERHRERLRPRFTPPTLRPSTRRKPDLLEPRAMPIEGFDEQVIPAAELKKRRKNLALDGLLAFMQDGRGIVRENAVRAVSALGKKEALAALPNVLVCLKDQDMDVRQAAIEVIQAIRGEARDAIPSLLRALRESPDELRDALIETIEVYGDDAIPPVLDHLDLTWGLVERCILPLVARRSEAYAQPIVARLKGAKASLTFQVRENLVDLIQLIGAPARDAQPQLVELLEERRGLMRTKAIRALASICDELPDKLIKRLEEILEYDMRRSVRHAAVDALIKFRGELEPDEDEDDFDSF